MSSTQTQQQKKNRKAFSKTLKAQIKRKPHTEPINGIEYTYGMLQKKSESSLFNNERFLLIRGHEKFGYASKLPEETLLPFLQTVNIPKCKVEIPLDKLQISNEKEVLIVDFQQDGKKEKTRWEFTCGSKVKAIEWRQKLQGAKNEKLMSMKNSSVKVILQDPNQSVEQSEYQNEKHNKKIVIQRPDTIQKERENQKKGIDGNDGLRNNKEKDLDEDETNIQRVKSKILVKDQDLSDEKKIDNFHRQNGKTNDLRNEKQQQKQNKLSANKQERFPQVNIFESLLYSSPSREQQPRQILDSSREKSSPDDHRSVQKSQTFTPEKISESPQEVSPNRLKEEFLKRKKEETQIKQELREQNSNSPSFFGSVIKTIADNKYQIQKLKKDWGYEFAKGNNEFEIVQRFKTYVEIVVVKIVDQLALQSKKRYYKPVSESTESLKYEIDGVYLEFFFHDLKEVTSFEKKGSIISHHRSKSVFQELKNYDYILQLTNNKGRIRVPLAMTVEYKGMVCLAKAIIPEAENYSNLESLQKELDLLQAESRISNSIFEDGENGRIVPLLNKAYDKLARTQSNFTSNNPKKFDICYIQGLKHYLPQDFYMYNSQGTKNTQSINPCQVLRKELIQHEDYDDSVFYGENMSNVIHRLKLPQHLKEAIDTLSEVSKSISERVHALVTALENLDEFITNSKDLSKLMHGYGLNMRYLGLLLEKSKESWLKSIIISQVSARCAKSFFRFDLQDCIMNLNETKMQNVRRYQIKQVITFMNKVLGNSEESDLFWTQLSRQAQENFQCYVDKKELNVGYFVQALQCQCRVQLVNVFERREDFFRVPEPLNVDNFCGFGLNSKTYDLNFTQLYTRVGQHLKDLTQESFEQLSILLNLQRKGSLPSHFQLNNFDEKVILYMINWLSPEEGRHIYYPEEIRLGEMMPTKTLYQIKLTQIKWLLREKKQGEAEKVRDWIVEHVNRWLGEYHPVLSELYELFSRYYSTSRTEQKKATTYCKSSIKNIEKLLGQTNIKLADNYYMLAEIYVNYQKKTEALSSLKRAREILEQREGQASQAYGIIQLRIGQLLLASGMFQEALTQGIRAYATLGQGDDQEKIVQAIELIGRCYELTGLWGDYSKFAHQLINVTTQLEQLVQDPLLLERSIKVLIMPYLSDITKNAQTSKQLLQALSLFSSLNNITPSAASTSYSYIKSLIQQRNGVFPQELIGILENDLQELLEEVESSGIMTRWKGFENLIQNKSLVQKLNSISALNAKAYEFLLMLEALAVFLGQDWIEGVLRDR